MSPAGGGRMIEYFRLSSGGGLGLALNCPPPIANYSVALAYPLTDMIKNFFLNFDPVHFSVGPATKPSSDMCLNEIIFLIRLLFFIVV